MIQINPKANPTYFNRPQMLAQLVAARTTVIVAGRRTGKTDSIGAPYALKMMQRMPGSTGGIVVPTFKHGLTNTLPGLFAAWARWGYKKGVHYVVGRRPPKSFAKPIIEPQQWENVISFYNGSVAVLLSPASQFPLTTGADWLHYGKYLNKFPQNICIIIVNLLSLQCPIKRAH